MIYCEGVASEKIKNSDMFEVRVHSFVGTLYVLIICLLISNLAVTCQSQAQSGQFNIFKSYGNAKVRPVQYAKQSRQHPIGEYLDATQKKMMKYRNGPDSAKLMFTDKGWTGNKKDNTNTGETRRLAVGMEEDQEEGQLGRKKLLVFSATDSPFFFLGLSAIAFIFFGTFYCIITSRRVRLGKDEVGDENKDLERRLRRLDATV